LLYADFSKRHCITNDAKLLFSAVYVWRPLTKTDQLSYLFVFLISRLHWLVYSCWRNFVNPTFEIFHERDFRLYFHSSQPPCRSIENLPQLVGWATESTEASQASKV